MVSFLFLSTLLSQFAYLMVLMLECVCVCVGGVFVCVCHGGGGRVGMELFQVLWSIGSVQKPKHL